MFGSYGLWLVEQSRRIKNSYRPASAFALGPIVDLVKSDQSTLIYPFYAGSRFVCRLPGGQLYYDSQLALDTDGSPLFTAHPKQHPDLYYDPNHQAATAWTPHGHSLDANEVPYFSMPLRFNEAHHTGIRKGDLAVVIYQNWVMGAVLADLGGRHLGEGSVALHRDLGHETIRDGRFHRSESIDRDVVTIVFPGTGNADVTTGQDILVRATHLFYWLMYEVRMSMS